MSKKGLKQNFQGGQKFGKWTLLKLKKSSANGVIFYCKNDEGEKKIIKLCKKKTQKAYLRFKIEIEAIKLAAEISGVISILDCQLPPDDFDDESDTVPYYVMREGEDFFEFIQGQPLIAKVSCITLIANTLSKLHKKKIYHRDIKYSNIIFIDSTPILIDFGIASIPDKPDITGNHTLGPKYTMAPEVQLAGSDERKKIKWDKVDMFSLGKTFWIIITEQKRGFTGQYTPDSSLSIKKY